MKKYFIAIFVLLSSVILALFIGNGAIESSKIIGAVFGNGTETERLIVFQIRIPRILAAAGAGTALSVSGFLLQGSLDNRIASPGILGINNGAGLFVLLSALLFPFNPGVKCIFAFVGALIVTVFVSLLSKGTGMSKTSVILSGVAVSAVCVSIIDFIISAKPETVADKTAFQLGGFANVQPVIVYLAVPVILIVLILTVIFAPGMDIIALGDETAHGLGLNVKNYRWLCVLLAAILAGAAISMSGIIGFVGLIVPNSIRVIFHVNSRSNVTLNAIYGASFLVLCDTAARIAAFPYEVPCGLILSLIGAPFLITILIKKRKRLGVG